MPQDDIYSTDYQRALAEVFHEPNTRIKSLRLYILDNPDSKQCDNIHNAINEYIRKQTLKNLSKECEF